MLDSQWFLFSQVSDTGGADRAHDALLAWGASRAAGRRLDLGAAVPHHHRRRDEAREANRARHRQRRLCVRQAEQPGQRRARDDASAQAHGLRGDGVRERQLRPVPPGRRRVRREARERRAGPPRRPPLLLPPPPPSPPPATPDSPPPPSPPPPP